jgi:hypothetical protein
MQSSHDVSLARHSPPTLKDRYQSKGVGGVLVSKEFFPLLKRGLTTGFQRRLEIDAGRITTWRNLVGEQGEVHGALQFCQRIQAVRRKLLYVKPLQLLPPLLLLPHEIQQPGNETDLHQHH